MALKNISFGCGFAGDIERPRAMAGPHQHPEIELNFLLDGEIVYLVRGKRVRVRSCRLAVFWASTPHQSVKVTASRFYWITIPLAWIYQWEFPSGFMNELLQGRVLIEDSEEDDEKSCARWVRDLKASQEGFREAAMLEIRARLLRVALGLSSKPDGLIPAKASYPVGAPLRVERIARFITQNYLSNITAGQIANAAGLNINYSSTLFRKQCGMSPSDYLILHRAHHAHRLIATTDKTIISVAFESGFRSVSRFYDAFKKIFRCTPRQVRRQGYWNS